jgi:transmembrane sensor
MISNEEQVRAAIAEQAGEWFVANDEGPLNARDALALAGWLRASPVHVEEFLGVSVIARDLRQLGAADEFSVETVVAGARTEEDAAVRPIWPRAIAPVRGHPSRRWLMPALTMAAMVALSVGLFALWNAGLMAPVSSPGAMSALHFETRHGELLNVRLPDNSVLHLNTDSAVAVRYGKTERLVTMTYGEAEFEVAHDPGRAFRVFAGSAEVVDIGTTFNVRMEHDSTLVTVVEGRVSVGLSPMLAKPGAQSGEAHAPQFVQLSAGQQIRVADDGWPATAAKIDTLRTTAWLRRQIVFEQEPLERVAAEFNRYGPKPIEIVTPALRNLQISGVFATDDTEAFIAFLRSLKGVRVEETATRIRVLRSPSTDPPGYT